MGYITLQSVTFSGTPAGTQLVEIMYRLTSDPDVIGSYTVLPGLYTIQTNGDISPDVNITGLLDRESYTVRIIPECGGGSHDIEITTGNVNEGLVYYGTKSSGVLPDESEALTGSTVLRDVSLDVPINWGATSPTPTWYWLFIPDIHIASFKTEWIEVPPNNGTMGPAELFSTGVTVNILGVPHHGYITNYATQFTANDYTFSN